VTLLIAGIKFAESAEGWLAIDCRLPNSLEIVRAADCAEAAALERAETKTASFGLKVYKKCSEGLRHF